MLKVVGTIFIKDNKLLLDKPRKRPTYQMVGGKVEENETVLEAAIRECHEELGPKAIIDPTKFELVMDFVEKATSDPNLKIHFHLFNYKGELKGEFSTSDEIESFIWYDTSMKDIKLSHVLNNKVIPYCINKKIIK
ncbi:MAG: NUDIX domain-containing protein [Bacilli bacterium]|nr:NUDIX domain-containing protein [Bacilli bacterium]